MYRSLARDKTHFVQVRHFGIQICVVKYHSLCSAYFKHCACSWSVKTRRHTIVCNTCLLWHHCKGSIGACNSREELPFLFKSEFQGAAFFYENSRDSGWFHSYLCRSVDNAATPEADSGTAAETFVRNDVSASVTGEFHARHTATGKRLHAIWNAKQNIFVIGLEPHRGNCPRAPWNAPIQIYIFLIQMPINKIRLPARFQQYAVVIFKIILTWIAYWSSN